MTATAPTEREPHMSTAESLLRELVNAYGRYELNHALWAKAKAYLASKPAEPGEERWGVKFDMLRAIEGAQAIVESKVLWKRFIDGTPLQNDIAVWMADFAHAYANPLPPSDQWIPVTERLPEEGVEVLVLGNAWGDRAKGTWQRVASWKEGNWHDGCYDDGVEQPLGYVTHWQPLPAPPKEPKP